MTYHRKFPALTLVLALLASCATPPSDEPKGVARFADDARLGEEIDRACFVRGIDRFSENTDDTVVLSAGPSRHYLVEVFGTCIELDRAQSIGIASRQTCLRRTDSLIVSTSAFSLNDSVGLGPERCRINAIYAWDPDAVKDETTEKDEAAAETES